MNTQNYVEEKHWELGSWNYTRKHWESGQEDSWESSHCFLRRYSWALYYSWAPFVLVPRDETGWDWDRESNADDSHVTVRLQLSYRAVAVMSVIVIHSHMSLFLIMF